MKSITSRVIFPQTLSRSVRAFSKLKPKTILIYGDSNTWGYDPECSTRSATARFNYYSRWTTICQETLGNEYRIVVEALNGRTTIHDDIIVGEGEYNCNGRTTLPEVLHSQKPLDMVIIALGANDLKEKFQASPHEVVGGVKILLKDVKKMTDIGNILSPVDNQQEGKKESGSCKLKQILHPPKLMVIGPPMLQPTPLNRLWGFPGDVDVRSRKVNGLLSIICKEARIPFVNITTITKVSLVDGVHLRMEDQEPLGKLLAEKILHALQQQ